MSKGITETDLHAAKKEIKEWQEVEAGAVFEIGRILKEVKESDIERGEWTDWLESIGYNPRTAQRYMQIYERFNEIPAAKDVSISMLTELLTLPVDVDVKPYIEETKKKTVREIREKVREVIGKGRPAKREQSESVTDVRIRVLKRQVRELAQERDRYKEEARQADQRAKQAEAQKWRHLFNGGVSGFTSRDILGISEGATPSEARARYRELMHLLHPDTGGDARLFDVIKKIYDSTYGRAS